MSNAHPPPLIVLVGCAAADRSAWVAAWTAADPGADPVTHRDLILDAPSTSEPTPTLCLLLGSDGDTAEAAARQALQRAGWAYSVLRGPRADQIDTARRAWQAARREPPPAPTRWRHVCARCGDGDCERALFDRLHGSGAPTR